MKHVYSKDAKVTKTVARDAHDPSTVYVHVETDERECLRKNEAIRSAELLPQDARSQLVEGDVIAFAFQFPTHRDFQLLRSLNPDIFGELEAGGDGAIRAAERLAILYPQYVVTTRRGDARRLS